MKNFSFEIEKIFIDSASITEEKCRYYSSEKEIDSSYLEEWRSARTLLNDNYFKEMLEIKNTSLQEFSFALQPLGIGNYKEVQWFKRFKNVIDIFDYSIVDFSDGIVMFYLPFLTFLKNQISEATMDLGQLVISEEIIHSFVEVAGTEMFNIFGKLIAIELEIYKHENNFESKSGNERF